MNARHGGRCFPFFAGFDHQQVHLETAASEAVQAAVAVGTGHIGIADHKDLAAGRNSGGQQLGTDAVQGSLPDHHLIRRRLQLHGNASERRGLGDGHGDCTNLPTLPLCVG